MTMKASKEITVKQYTLDGVESGAAELAKELIAYTPNKVLLAQYERMYLANQREGNASAQTRAEVTGSTKKIYKQKGTGNARHGSRKAPLFKGGGVVGGPKPQEHRLEFSKNQRKGALLSAIAYQVQQGAVCVLASDVTELPAKTKTVAQFLTKTNMEKGSTLFVLLDAKATGFVKSARNIERVTSTHMGSLNVHSLLEARHIVVVAEAFKTMQQMFTK